MQVVGSVGWNNERLAVPANAHPAVRELLTRCFGPPADRPSFSEIISILKRRLQGMGPPPPQGQLSPFATAGDGSAEKRRNGAAAPGAQEVVGYGGGI
jgi:hypothetical protein